MCIFHQSPDYGKILLKQKFKQNSSKTINFALQISTFIAFPLTEIERSIEELIEENVLIIDKEYLVCERMVKDEYIRQVRAEAGSKGGKKSTKNFAQAKTKQIVEDVDEEEDKDEVIIKKDKIPSIVEFLMYGSILCGETNKDFHQLKFAFEAKYDSWKENRWKDGHNKQIKNWKTKLRNTFPHLKAISNQQHGKSTSQQDHQRIHDQLERSKFQQGGNQ